MHTLSWLTPGKLINLSEPHFLFFLVIKKKKNQNETFYLRKHFSHYISIYKSGVLFI